MASRPKRGPRNSGPPRRRVPSQERARRLVANVIDATAQVLSEVGVEGLSTNKVARAAGVAIGSVYQYFPDKEALLEAVVQDRFARLARLGVDRMADVRDLSYPGAAEVVLRAAVDFFATEPGLAEVLAPRLAVAPTDPEARNAVQEVHDLARAYLTGASGDLRIADPDLAATVSIGVVSHFAPRIAALPDDIERERMTGEVVALLSRYVGAT